MLEEMRNSRNISEYWTGENLDPDNLLALWDAYFAGDEYIKRFHLTKTTRVKIEFELPPQNDPLFNFEVMQKTLKGLYYNFKKYCLTDRNEFNEAIPLFIDSTERGSVFWNIYIQSSHVLHFVRFLVDAYEVCHAINEGKHILKNLSNKIFEEKLGDKNKEREKKNLKKIDQANVENLIQDFKEILTNLLLKQHIKKIIIEDEHITIDFVGTHDDEKTAGKDAPINKQPKK